MRECYSSQSPRPVLLKPRVRCSTRWLTQSCVHLGQSELDAAVANADRRNYDDAWLWSRRTSETDISPLVAVTLAHWVARQRVLRIEDNIW